MFHLTIIVLKKNYSWSKPTIFTWIKWSSRKKK